MVKNNKFVGTILALAGIFCLIYPIATSISVDIVLGACLFVGAIFTLFQTPQEKTAWGKGLYFVFAILYAIAGFFMLANPLAGTVALTITIGAVFVVQSIFMFAYSGKVSHSNSAMVLLNAVVTLILGLLILFNLAQGLWIVGILVGVNLLFTGIVLFSEKLPQE